jgi:hypothetical protein
MTNEPSHPLPPDVWSDPPLAPYQPKLEANRPVTTMNPPTGAPPQ